MDVTQFAEERAIGFVQWLAQKSKTGTIHNLGSKKILKGLYLQYLAHYYAKLIS